MIGRVQNTIKTATKFLLRSLRQTADTLAPLSYRSVLLLDDGAQQHEHEIIDRYRRYCPSEELPVVKRRLSVRDLVSEVPILVFDDNHITRFSRTLKGNRFCNVNHYSNAEEGWNWFKFLEYYHRLPDLSRRKRSQRTFLDFFSRLKAESLDRVYLFGTGTSLEKALTRDFSNGYRVVCNTIVKDPELWHHLKPHVIVAGDAIYHFGPDSYAVAFRNDLRKRLAESETFFVYPEHFDYVVSKELAEFENRLIPIPFGSHKEICCDLSTTFELPEVGNILNCLLLPVGCTLSHQIYLWGFDGRAPGDKFFWANSDRHFYGEHFQSLMDAHPSFFNHHVPTADPTKYVMAVHGDELDRRLAVAEKRGFKFEMMHFSWTATLNKRFPGSVQSQAQTNNN